MPKKSQTWCFQPPFTLRKQTKKSKDKYERNRRYEKMRSFFLLCYELNCYFGPFLGPVFASKKCLKMPKKGQTWCFQPPFTLTKCTMKPDDKYERNWRYEKMRLFFALLRADLAVSGPVSGPVFSILSPDFMQTSLFDPANANISTVPFF